MPVLVAILNETFYQTTFPSQTGLHEYEHCATAFVSDQWSKHSTAMEYNPSRTVLDRWAKNPFSNWSKASNSFDLDEKWRTTTKIKQAYSTTVNVHTNASEKKRKHSNVWCETQAKTKSSVGRVASNVGGSALTKHQSDFRTRCLRRKTLTYIEFIQIRQTVCVQYRFILLILHHITPTYSPATGEAIDHQPTINCVTLQAINWAKHRSLHVGRQQLDSLQPTRRKCFVGKPV